MKWKWNIFAMKLGRGAEFFEDGSGAFSMNRLTLFGAFFISSSVMLTLTAQDKMTEGIFGLYLGAFVAGNVLNKMSEIKATMGKTDAPAT